MPTEIEKSPENFRKELLCVRMSFIELVNVLEKMEPNIKGVTAISNDAAFDGLDDIKSAPARFSGEPFIQFFQDDPDGGILAANVDFNKGRTTVTAGEYRGNNSFKKGNQQLAQYVFEELKPFSRPWESWVQSVAAILGWVTLLIILFVELSMSVGYIDNGDFQLAEHEDSPVTGNVVIGACFVLIALHSLLRRRLPVIYNPRETFWQKHGEAAMVGAVASVFTALVVAYLTGNP